MDEITGKFQPPTIILGMHRSGTSCLAGSLEEAGLFLGDVKQQNPDNQKGNRENLILQKLNADVLKSNEGSWLCPPMRTEWSDAHKIRRDEIIATYPSDRSWGFKDPRTLFTLDGWLEALPDARLIATFRHPATVAKSLQIRNEFPLEKSFELWRQYNEKLLYYLSKRGGQLICFDDPADLYQKHLTVIIGELSLLTPKRGVEFFTSELRHNSVISEVKIPTSVAVLYVKLQKMSQDLRN